MMVTNTGAAAALAGVRTPRMQDWFTLYRLAEEKARDLRAEADRDRLARAIASTAGPKTTRRVAATRPTLPVRARCWTLRARRLSITITLRTEVH
jgi:hypothetical protein